jgi:hypothetical protein
MIQNKTMLKSYKTTIIGLVGAALTFLYQYQTNGGNLTDWKLYTLPLLIALFGAYTKDHNVTGQ